MRDHPEFKTWLKDWQKYTGQFVRNPYFKNPKLYIEDVNVRDHIYLNNDEFASFLKEDFQEDFIEENYCGSLLRNRMMNELSQSILSVFNFVFLQTQRHRYSETQKNVVMGV